MAGVAKWLRQWIVIPPFGGSSPLVRPEYLTVPLVYELQAALSTNIVSDRNRQEILEAIAYRQNLRLTT